MPDELWSQFRAVGNSQRSGEGQATYRLCDTRGGTGLCVHGGWLCPSTVPSARVAARGVPARSRCFVTAGTWS